MFRTLVLLPALLLLPSCLFPGDNEIARTMTQTHMGMNAHFARVVGYLQVLANEARLAGNEETAQTIEANIAKETVPYNQLSAVQLATIAELTGEAYSTLVAQTESTTIAIIKELKER